MAEPEKTDPVDVAMWIAALVLFVVSGAMAAFLFGWFGGFPVATEAPAPSATATPVEAATPSGGSAVPAGASPAASVAPMVAPSPSPAPSPTPLHPLEPGPHEVTIEYEGFPVQTRTVDVNAGALQSLKVRFGAP